jgi:hypothetical protein
MNLKYRTIFENFILQKIQLQINDWAGSKKNDKKEIKVQPFMCKPYAEAATYGFELIYPYETTVEVDNTNGVFKFITTDDWANDQSSIKKIGNIPIGQISDQHFGINTGLDIKAPRNHILRIEPHPAFFGKDNYPCAIPGHLETDWWSSLFFVVFKAPAENTKLVFYKGMPIAQCFILPKNNKFIPALMSEKEAEQRRIDFSTIHKNRNKISQNYKDANGNIFDHTYKSISNYVNNYGIKGFKNFIKNLQTNFTKIKKLGFRLFKK